MRAIIQRTIQATVCVDGEIAGEIKTGLLVLLGISRLDTMAQARYLAERVPKLRVFEDDSGRMNLDSHQVGGSFLVVPNFTLYGECRRGLRPSFEQAAPPDEARPLFESFVSILRDSGLPVQTGIFQAHMEVTLTNSGPVTFVLDAD